MSAPTQVPDSATTATPSQKRPLEEPSSPVNPEDEPEAKRPALDKIVQESGQQETEKLDVAGSATTNGNRSGLESATADVNQSTTDAQGDTAVQDAPAMPPASAATLLETQPIQSTTALNAASNGSNYQPPDETSWLHMRAIISSTEAATVIGKGGENVSQIRKLSGAKCTVSDYSRGAIERILTVSGLVDAVAKAFGLIIRTLNNEPMEQPSTAQSRTYPLRLLIPHILIGSIIGKGGVRIKEIQEESGARLNASDSCLPMSSERSLVVLGVADAVHIATYYVGQTLVEQLTDRFGGPAASAYATRSGGSVGAVPGGMQVSPYVPQNAGGIHSHPDRWRPLPGQQSQRMPTSNYALQYGAQYGQQYPNPYGAPAAQAPQGAPAIQQPIHYGGQQAARTGYNAAGPYPAQPAYGAAGAAAGAAQPNPAVGAAPNAMPIMAGGHQQQQIYIPNDMVGAIIGKGGQKINEIRSLSGSTIKINEPDAGSNERLVTITGTKEACHMALYMLYSRLENEKHRM